MSLVHPPLFLLTKCVSSNHIPGAMDDEVTWEPTGLADNIIVVLSAAHQLVILVTVLHLSWTFKWPPCEYVGSNHSKPKDPFGRPLPPPLHPWRIPGNLARWPRINECSKHWSSSQIQAKVLLLSSLAFRYQTTSCYLGCCDWTDCPFVIIRLRIMDSCPYATGDRPAGMSCMFCAMKGRTVGKCR